MTSPYVFPGLKIRQFTKEEVIEAVEKTACEVWDIEPKELSDRWRRTPARQARQFCMWYLRYNTTQSLKTIGRLYNRDHSTVCNAITIVQQTNEKSDPKFYERIQQALKYLN
jgi:chromosomal replication initiation ATPase DnaA